MSKVIQRMLPWSSHHEAIIWLMAMLLLAGAINVFSATFVLAEGEGGTPYTYILKHLTWIVVGTGAFIVSSVVDYHKWRNLIMPITGGIFLILLLVPVVGTTVNGATRWIYIGSVSVQPAEFAKICSVMLESYYLAHCINQKRKINIFTPNLAIIFALFVAVELEPDMGTACVIAGVPLVMMFISGLSKVKMERLGGGMVCIIIFLIAYQPYRLERVKTVFDPWADAQGIGYQTVQSLTAIGSGEFWGMGLGKGLAKYAYLPEAHTDFAFAVFCQENGFLIALVLLAVYGLFAYYAARISTEAYDAYGQVLAGGVMILLIGQAVVNMLMVMGCFPVVGVPLPFISYGGSSLIATMFSTGILININRYSLIKRRQGNLKEG